MLKLFLASVFFVHVQKSGFIVKNSHEEHFFPQILLVSGNRRELERALAWLESFWQQVLGCKVKILPNFPPFLSRSQISPVLLRQQSQIILMLCCRLHWFLAPGTETSRRQVQWCCGARQDPGVGSPGRSAQHLVSIWHLPGCDCSWPPQQHAWPCNTQPNFPIVLTSSPLPHLLDSSPSPSTQWTQGKACCCDPGCTWALWERHSCRLWEPVGFCSQNDLFITCVYNVHCKEVWLWPTDVRHRCQVNMNGEGQACYSNGRNNNNKKNHNYQKNICDHKRISCSCSPISSLASLKREEIMRERKERKNHGERQGGVERKTKTVDTFNLSQYNTSF